ncbi:FMN-binding protein [Vibrio olivae]
MQKDGGEFAQFSGATITPRAVVKGIHAALQAQQVYLKKRAPQTETGRE